MKLQIKFCTLARRHHRQSRRQFAHVFHHRNTICVTPEFYELPQTYQVGILVHEIGHLHLGSTKHTEKEADQAAEDFFGVSIRRKTYHGMAKLEWISPKEKAKALEILRNL